LANLALPLIAIPGIQLDPGRDRPASERPRTRRVRSSRHDTPHAPTCSSTSSGFSIRDGGTRRSARSRLLIALSAGTKTLGLKNAHRKRSMTTGFRSPLDERGG